MTEITPDARLVGMSNKNPGPFEARALMHLSQQPDTDFYARYYDRKDKTKGYRYAAALYGNTEENKSCLECHAKQAGVGTGLLGIVSVDIQSQIEAGQAILNRFSFIAAGLLAGVVAIIVFYLITTRLILKPVRVLQKTAEKVRDGDLDIRSAINTGDEFQQLSETFNTMLSNLKNSADQLRAINKGLDVKLGQLAESNVALYESNRLKSEFLANVSHELRTPLNSILGFAELLKDAMGTQMDPKTARYVQNIVGSGKNLLDLINDLLDLAKIEAGKMEVRSEPISLSDLFEGLANILKPLLESKKLELVDKVAAEVPILHTDPAKLQQVLYNFLSNAIKFSPPEGKVYLSAEVTDDSMVKISVTDEGPGIDPEKHKLIFEKFRQIDGSVTRQHGGTGLGLAISKDLVGLLGGAIGVDSEPGHGATFWVKLPQAIIAGAQDIRARLVLT
jgi:two-component system, NarL family, sensor histidine kinase BarA